MENTGECIHTLEDLRRIKKDCVEKRLNYHKTENIMCEINEAYIVIIEEWILDAEREKMMDEKHEDILLQGLKCIAAGKTIEEASENYKKMIAERNRIIEEREKTMNEKIEERENKMKSEDEKLLTQGLKTLEMNKCFDELRYLDGRSTEEILARLKVLFPFSLPKQQHKMNYVRHEVIQPEHANHVPVIENIQDFFRISNKDKLREVLRIFSKCTLDFCDEIKNENINFSEIDIENIKFKMSNTGECEIDFNTVRSHKIFGGETPWEKEKPSDYANRVLNDE